MRIDLSAVSRVAIDETSARRDRHYITLFIDIGEARVVPATKGRDAETIAVFADDLARKAAIPTLLQRSTPT